MLQRHNYETFTTNVILKTAKTANQNYDMLHEIVDLNGFCLLTVF
jgi:hypothetical protein